MMNRRSLLGGVGDALAGAALAKFSFPFAAYAEDVTSLPFANGERPLARYPGKRPLIRTTSRPPQLETPFAVFNEGVI
jgi:sulfite dehydrogenase